MSAHILRYITESGTIVSRAGCLYSANLTAGTAAAASLALLAGGQDGSTISFLRAPAGQSASRILGADGALYGGSLYASLSGVGSVADAEI